MHGDARTDDYYWLRDDSRKDQEVRKQPVSQDSEPTAQLQGVQPNLRQALAMPTYPCTGKDACMALVRPALPLSSAKSMLSDGCRCYEPCGLLQIVGHLNAETAYCKAALADTEDLQEQLYTEMRGRIQVSVKPSHDTIDICGECELRSGATEWLLVRERSAICVREFTAAGGSHTFARCAQAQLLSRSSRLRYSIGGHDHANRSEVDRAVILSARKRISLQHSGGGATTIIRALRRGSSTL